MFRFNIYHKKTRQSPLEARNTGGWLTQHCLAIYSRSLSYDSIMKHISITNIQYMVFLAYDYFL